MIKDYKTYNESTVPNMEYIVGIPSGIVIDINYKDVNNLKQNGLISWNVQYKCYSFKDDIYTKVLDYLNKHGYNKSIKSPKEFNQKAMEDIINFFDIQRNVRNYIILPDGIEVSGDVYVCNANYTKIPFKFKKVSGDFTFKFCKLESLENSPDVVGGNFIVKGNNILRLREGPTYVGKLYDCSDNFLSSLEGSPDKIYGDFDCSGNYLTDLNGAPRKIFGDFDCSDNRIENPHVEIDCSHFISDSSSKKKYREEATYRW